MTTFHPKREAAIQIATEARRLSLDRLSVCLGEVSLANGNGDSQKLYFAGRSNALRDDSSPSDRGEAIAIFVTEAIQEQIPRERIDGCRAAALWRPPTASEIRSRLPRATGGALELLGQDPDDPGIFRLAGRTAVYIGLSGDSF